MRRRLVTLCLLAYPRGTRERDGAFLRDLALDLVAQQGTTPQLMSLLRCGIGARMQRCRKPTVLAGLAGVVAATVTAGLLLVPAAGSEEHIEITVVGATGQAGGRA